MRLSRHRLSLFVLATTFVCQVQAMQTDTYSIEKASYTVFSDSYHAKQISNAFLQRLFMM